MCHAAPAPAFSFSRTDSGLAVGADNSPRSFSEFVGGGSNEVCFKGPPRFEWCRGGALAAGSIIFVVVKLLLFFIIIHVYVSVVSGTVRTSFALELFIIIFYSIVTIICYYIPSQRQSADVLKMRTRWCNVTRSAGSRDPRLSFNIYQRLGAEVREPLGL